jgi:hypothetical protein
MKMRPGKRPFLAACALTLCAGMLTNDTWEVTRPNSVFGDFNPYADEINARRTVFYPSETGHNFITVRGFTLEHAATPWAPPTAEQVGLIDTHWSKGWIINHPELRRDTPWQVEHGTEIASLMNTKDGDNRFHNNIFIVAEGLPLPHLSHWI